MNCTQTRRLLGAYVDGELDPPSRASVAQHLIDCGTCSLAQGQLTDLAHAAKPLRRPLPPGLESAVRSAVRADLETRRTGALRRWRLTALASLAACVFVAVTLTWTIVRPARPRVYASSLTEQAVAAHVRSLMADHLFDVASSDRHTVKPWFAGRTDFSPDVRDLAPQGFSLAGGRLDYLAGRPVAALVYRRNAHVINAFTWPAGELDSAAPTGEERNGYHVLRWRTGGMMWCLVSDAGESTLAELRELLRGSSPSPATTSAR